MSTHSEKSSHHPLSTILFALLLILAAMLLMGQSASAPDEGSSDGTINGKEVFDSVCATCHTIQPPPNLAPPMAMVVRHYRMELTDSAAIRDALISWVGAPDSSKSLLPARAIERFGLMAPLTLSSDETEAVVDYVMTLEPESDGQGMMGGSMKKGAMMQGGMMQGKMKQGGMQQNGMMGRAMMQMDSTTAAMNCPRADSSAAAMNCARTGNAPGTTCPRAKSDSTSTSAAMGCRR